MQCCFLRSPATHHRANRSDSTRNPIVIRPDSESDRIAVGVRPNCGRNPTNLLPPSSNFGQFAARIGPIYSRHHRIPANLRLEFGQFTIALVRQCRAVHGRNVTMLALSSIVTRPSKHINPPNLALAPVIQPESNRIAVVSTTPASGCNSTRFRP